MKYLLVLAVLLVAVQVWRHKRGTEVRTQDRPAPPAPGTRTPAPPNAMVTCRHCGLHLPHSEAVRGALGPYCGEEHRRLAEG